MEVAPSGPMPTLQTQATAPVSGALLTATLVIRMEAASAAWLLISGNSSGQGASP